MNIALIAVLAPIITQTLVIPLLWSLRLWAERSLSVVVL